jgi:hypothetical protein
MNKQKRYGPSAGLVAGVCGKCNKWHFFDDPCGTDYSSLRSELAQKNFFFSGSTTIPFPEDESEGE